MHDYQARDESQSGTEEALHFSLKQESLFGTQRVEGVVTSGSEKRKDRERSSHSVSRREVVGCAGVWRTKGGTQLTVKVGRPRYAGPRDCPHCGKRYSTIAALKYHVGLVHSVSDQVPCFYCPQWFDIRTDLKKHLEVAHNEHS
ncbi:hypothetical protein E2C01_048894 [Portunus trituberculatus]|uniref:C2H2-type domain-containing protein n=1 Tax=Portunus trituberculatus TaxID=210409 RepID=A0A5B7GEJ5_PORTR|nr:hypothetical protein [Portunus trituberculatus]